MEFISSSTQLEATQDWFTDRIVELMRERKVGFVDAARLVAHDNLTGHDEHATRSARPDPLGLFRGEPPVRAAVVFAVAHQRAANPDPDLPLVAEQLAPDGIATRALVGDYGEGRTTIRRDPTAAEIVGTIQAAVVALGDLARRAGTSGELLVFFDGHGDSHGMVGSDGKELPFDELLKLNDQAVAANVRLVVVSNGCYQAAGVLLAELLANRALEQRLTAAKLPAERAAALAATLAGAARLIDLGRSLSQPLEEVGRIAHGADHAWSAAETAAALRRTLSGVERLAGAGPELDDRIQAVRHGLSGDGADAARVVELAPVLNDVSDRLTEEIARLQELVGAELDVAAGSSA
jgi:hypothetical protein